MAHGLMLRVAYCPIIPLILCVAVPLRESGKTLWKEVGSCSLEATEFAQGGKKRLGGKTRGEFQFAVGSLHLMHIEKLLQARNRELATPEMVRAIPSGCNSEKRSLSWLEERPPLQGCSVEYLSTLLCFPTPRRVFSS